MLKKAVWVAPVLSRAAASMRLIRDNPSGNP